MADDFSKTSDDIAIGPESLMGRDEISFVTQKATYPSLEIIAGPREGLFLPLKHGSHIVGRASGNPLHLDDTSVSRVHAQISYDGTTVTLKDMGSRNGTSVNGERLEGDTARPLKHLDQIKIGIYLFRLAMKPITEADLPPPPPKPDKSVTYVAQESDKKGLLPPSKEDKDVPSASEEKLEPAESVLSAEPPQEPPRRETALMIPPLSQVPEDKLGVRLKYVFLALCLISSLGGLIYFFISSKKNTEEPVVQTEQPLNPQTEKDIPLPELTESPSAPEPRAQEPQAQEPQAQEPQTQEPLAQEPKAPTVPQPSVEVSPDKPSSPSSVTSPSPTQESPTPESPTQEPTTPGQTLPTNQPVSQSPPVLDTPSPSSQPVAPEPVAPESVTPESVTPSVVSVPSQAPVSSSSARPMTMFLDVSASPTVARISFEGRDLGSTPLKTGITVEPGKTYEVTAQFDLKDLRDQFQQKISFVADPGKEVVPLVFKAELGVLKVLALPRGVSFSLQGYYAYDKLKSHKVQMDDVLLGQPVYLPYGNYTVELRERMKLKDSKTEIDQIRYHRDFKISAENKTVSLSIKERDFQFFPARIESVPKGAEVWLDNQKLGITPYQGEMPVGRHELRLKYEGFFDYVNPLDMQMSTPYEAVIEMKTSQVGELINQAEAYRRSGQYQESVNKLVEALSLGGTDREKAAIHFGLGESFFWLKNYDQAATDYDQARVHSDFNYKALLGMARSEYALGDKDRALTHLVEVLLNNKDGSLSGQADALFKQISPIKSVIYISTEPAGASVMVNSEELGQKTPIILSDLDLGNYQIQIEKNGYKTEQIKQNLKISEFVPIFIKLQPGGS